MKTTPRFLATGLCGLLTLLLSAGAARAQEWVDHKSDAGGYSARFPGQPKNTVQKVQTAVGDIQMNIALVERPASGYTVIFAKFPPAIEQAPADAVLEGAKQGMIGKGINITSAKKISIGDYPGRELVGTNPDGTHLRARLFLVKATMYQVIIAAKNEKELTDDTADKFVRSFRLLNTPEKK